MVNPDNLQYDGYVTTGSELGLKSTSNLGFMATVSRDGVSYTTATYDTRPATAFDKIQPQNGNNRRRDSACYSYNEVVERVNVGYQSCCTCTRGGSECDTAPFSDTALLGGQCSYPDGVPDSAPESITKCWSSRLGPQGGRRLLSAAKAQEKSDELLSVIPIVNECGTKNTYIPRSGTHDSNCFMPRVLAICTATYPAPGHFSGFGSATKAGCASGTGAEIDCVSAGQTGVDESMKLVVGGIGGVPP